MFEEALHVLPVYPPALAERAKTGVMTAFRRGVLLQDNGPQTSGDATSVCAEVHSLDKLLSVARVFVS